MKAPVASPAEAGDTSRKSSRPATPVRMAAPLAESAPDRRVPAKFLIVRSPFGKERAW